MALNIKQNALLQAILIGALWFACEVTVSQLKLPLPGGILGLGITLLLLISEKIRIESLHSGASLLIKDMLLFFIPAVLAIVEHHEFVGLLGLKILGIILISTTFSMLITAFVVNYCYQWKTHHAKPPTR